MLMKLIHHFAFYSRTFDLKLCGGLCVGKTLCKLEKTDQFDIYFKLRLASHFFTSAHFVIYRHEQVS